MQPLLVDDLLRAAQALLLEEFDDGLVKVLREGGEHTALRDLACIGVDSRKTAAHN